MARIKLQDISKSFGKTRVLSDINLDIKEGTFCVVLGPSGCGKSTLLNIIAGLEEPSSGRIFIGDRDVTALPPHKRNIAMVFQSYALYPHLSVFENIAFGLRIKKEKEEDIREKVTRASEILNISDKLDNFPRELSGGERQRVATGRAIVRDPVLFLFDEPLSNLDARLRIELRSEFIKLHQKLKKTIVYVTHDQVEAMALGDEIVVLKDGAIQQVSSPTELYHNPRNLFVAGFIGTPPMNISRFTVAKIENTMKLARDSCTIDIPGNKRKALERYIDREIYVGFRPSAARLDHKGTLRGEVLFNETIGEDSFAHVKLGKDLEIVIKIDEDTKPKPHSTVQISVDTRRMFFFGDGPYLND